MDENIVDKERNENPVKDTYKFVFFAFAFLGSCTLLPWNFFITATTYFQFRLRTNKSETEIDFLNLNDLQVSYPNQMALFSMIPLALTNITNLIIKDKINGSFRIIVGNMLLLLMFTLTVILVGVDISDKVFLGITFISIMLINIGSALFQGSIMGVLGMMPGNYIGIFFQGQAVAGIFTALVSIILAPFNITEIQKGALFFSVPILFSILAFVIYYGLNKSEFYLHHMRKANFEPSFFNLKKNDLKNNEEQSLLNNENGTVPQEAGHNIIKKFLCNMKEVLYFGLGAFFTLCFTLAVFPSLLVLIKPMNYSKTDPWTQTYFLLVVIFLSFNLNDYFGRFLATQIQWPKPRSKRLLLGLVLSRGALVILILFFNQTQKKYIPTIFYHDAWLIVFVIIFGLSNGYLLNLCFMYAPTSCTPGNEEAAGVAMSIYLSIGLGIGVSISFVLQAIL